MPVYERHTYTHAKKSVAKIQKTFQLAKFFVCFCQLFYKIIDILSISPSNV